MSERTQHYADGRRSSRNGRLLAWASTVIGFVACAYWPPAIWPHLRLVAGRSVATFIWTSEHGYFWTCCCGEIILPIIGVVAGIASLKATESYRRLAWLGIILSIVSEAIFVLLIVLSFIFHPRLT